MKGIVLALGLALSAPAFASSDCFTGFSAAFSVSAPAGQQPEVDRAILDLTWQIFVLAEQVRSRAVRADSGDLSYTVELSFHPGNEYQVRQAAEDFRFAVAVLPDVNLDCAEEQRSLIAHGLNR